MQAYVPVDNPTTVYFNATVLTMSESQPHAEGFAVSEGKISAVGSTAELRERYTGTSAAWVNLRNSFVIPGFIDAHCHFALGAFCDLWPSVSDGDFAIFKSDLPAAWIRLRQPPQWFKHLPLASLDALFPNRPAIIVERGYHGCSLNTAARRLLAEQSCHEFEGLLTEPGTLGPTTLTNLPPAEAFTDSESCAVYEAAMGYAENCSRDWFQEHYPQEVLQGLHKRAYEFLTHGITTVCDAAITPKLAELLATATKQQNWPIRFIALLSGERGFFSTPSAVSLQLFSGAPKLSCWGAKLFIDGGRQSLLRFEDGSIRGHQYYSLKELTTIMTKFLELGLNIACHAMGNHAVELALTAWCTAQQSTKNFTSKLRVEHAAILTDNAIARLKASGAYVVIQPGWITWTGPLWLKNPYLQFHFLPFADLSRDAALVAGSSDCTDGEIPSPLNACRAAVLRQTASSSVLDSNQAVEPIEALKWYTRHAAEACGIANECGSLVPGKSADFLVLPEDPCRTLSNVTAVPTITATFVEGVRRYPDPRFESNSPLLIKR